MRPNVYLAVELTSGFLRVRHAGSTIYSKRRLDPDRTHLVSIIIGSQVKIGTINSNLLFAESVQAACQQGRVCI